MARQVLPIAGQIIGGMIGGPVGAAIGGALGSAIGQYVDPIRHQGPKLGEARAQTAQEGVYRPLVFGTGCVAGNVIHRSPRKVVVHREDASGKGNRDTVDSERGYRTFAIRIAEAHTPEGYQLLRIWENETLVYDVRPESEILAESVEYAEKFRFYPGTQDQLPDPDLEAYMGVGNVNAYRGSCYIVFGNFDLTDYGDMVPQYRFEIASAYESGLGTSFLVVGNGVVKSSADAAEWSEWHPASWAIPYAAAAGNNRHILWHHVRPFEWTSNGGLTFAQSDGAGSSGSGGGQGGSTGADGLTVMIASGGEPVRVSLDAGLSFQERGAPSTGIFRVVNVGAHWVGIQQHRVYASPDVGWSWNIIAGPTIGVYYYAIYSNYQSAWISGSEPDGQFVIRLDKNLNATRLPAPPTRTDESVVSICSNGDGSVVLLGTDKGRIYCSEGAGWFLAQDEDNVRWNAIAFNGRRFVAVGAGVSDSIVLRSTDGRNWDAVSDDMAGATNVVAYPPAISPSFGERIPLHSVIDFCHRRVSSTPSEYDTSALTDLLDGVVFADGYTARDAITTLLPIYNADASEHDQGSGYRINYIKRGAPVVRTLTIDDLVDEPEETVREDPMERPRVLHMAFESPVTGYTAGKASIQRLSPDVKLVNEVSTYVPVTFKDVDEAWQRADVQMRVTWTEVHGERKFSISDAHIDLVPTDNVALSLRGQVQRLRLQKNEYADGVMKLEAMADRQSNYTSHVTGIPLPAPEKPPPSLMGPAALAILDIPAISDQHDRLGYYVAVTGTADAFAGAVVQRQQNGAWADVVSIGRSQRATMGVLENAVSAGSEHYTDTTNTVSVTLYMDAELESLSNAQWLNKGGAFALETATGWEIMQYRDAEHDSDGVWHLSHLARGRLNTGPDEHLPGARFVLLDGVRFIDANVGMIGQSVTLRAAAVGRSPETAVPETITYQGNSQREFPLAHLLSDGIEGGEITVQMVPRHRFGTEDHPVRSANWTGYRLHASVVVAQQTVDTLADEYTFTVPGPASGIAITAGQMNRYTGLGPTTSETYLK